MKAKRRRNLLVKSVILRTLNTPVTAAVIIVLVVVFIFICLRGRTMNESISLNEGALVNKSFYPSLNIPQNSEEDFNSSSTPSTAAKMKISRTTSFPHEYLPGFNIQIPNGYQLEFKQFGESAKKNFSSQYFHTCDEPCMGVKITKNDVGVELTFDIVMDDNAIFCSGNAGYTLLKNNWVRVQDRNGYSYDIRLRNYIGEYINSGGRKYTPIAEDYDWNASEDDNDVVCLWGTGNGLIKQPPLEQLSGNLMWADGGIMLERPRVIGNPTADELTEIDNMVLSIVGVHN